MNSPPKSPKLGLQKDGIKKKPPARKEHKSILKDVIKEGAAKGAAVEKSFEKDVLANEVEAQDTVGNQPILGNIENEEDPKLAGDSECYSAEYEVVHPTSDAMRNKVRMLLEKALCTDNAGAPGAEKISAAIEESMFKTFKSNGPPYKRKYRMLSFNLKDPKNIDLRKKVLAKLIPPSELINMTSEELANDELKRSRAETDKKLIRDSQPLNKPEATTDKLKCGKCKQRKCTCTYYHDPHLSIRYQRHTLTSFYFPIYHRQTNANKIS